MIDKNKLMIQFKKMKLTDFKALIILMITYIPGRIYKIICKDVWIITEYEFSARDNGYWLFKYIRENFPHQKVYYPISSMSPDYFKVKTLGNNIKFGGVFHYILFWGCNKFIGTTKYYGFPYGRICEDLVQWNIHKFKNIFLNHGFARGYSSIVDARETNYNLIFAMSPIEKEIMINENYQDENKIICAGFCRHDNLDSSILDKKTILIMPTWRKWLDFRLETDIDIIDVITKRFLDSFYYKKFFSILNNQRLIEFLENNNYNLIFYLHDYAQCFSKYFSSSSKKICIASKAEYDIQSLLKQSALLITDYSSVSYDFAYMYKPLLYYQFDLNDFEEKQYAQGNKFTYRDNAFGEIIESEEILIDRIIYYCQHQNVMPNFYKKRVDNFFLYHDKRNCERVYNAIKKL